MGQQVNVYRELKFFPGAIITGWGAQGEGRTYYVNNITGSSTAEGRSWNSAVDQVEQAISLSETFRQLGSGAPSVTTNDYVRNTVIIQGTGTPYTAVTSIPNYTDLIGLGADPRGNGTGIAKIDGAGTEDAMSVSSAGCRGLYMVNLQFNSSAAGSFYGADFAKLFRSTIETCTFTNGGLAGLRIVLGGGVVMRDIACGNDTYAQITGMILGNGATVNACKITDSEFYGDTQGVLFSAVAGEETVFKNCFARGGSYGFKDTTSSSVGAQPQYIKCYGFGTASSNINDGGFKISNNYASHSFGCISNSNGTLFTYPTATA